ncbi:hypothetical protein KFE80_02075 [bacterium SCSIO 12696]|nr:hypothetical protein KFE80_02075 [bacterium SCSIO 12696]
MTLTLPSYDLSTGHIITLISLLLTLVATLGFFRNNRQDKEYDQKELDHEMRLAPIKERLNRLLLRTDFFGSNVNVSLQDVIDGKKIDKTIGAREHYPLDAVCVALGEYIETLKVYDENIKIRTSNIQRRISQKKYAHSILKSVQKINTDEWRLMNLDRMADMLRQVKPI